MNEKNIPINPMDLLFLLISFVLIWAVAGLCFLFKYQDYRGIFMFILSQFLIIYKVRQAYTIIEEQAKMKK